MSRESTAFNVDYKLAYQRACMEGGNEWLRKDVPLPGFPSYPNGSGEQMLWGCVGDWYSGEWYDAKALTYIQRVREELAKRGWRNYQD
jgi:autotransporter family porin